MPRPFDRPWVVFAVYVALTLLMTWPIVTGLGRDLPSDLGDPVFVAGMLTWGSEHWLDLLSGDLSARRRFWDAPWFYPDILATAFSEHLALHSLLTLPMYAITRNSILSYNLLFLSTFALSGFGMYLLVRELTGRPLAAFVAGLAFAFAPYRIASLSHLQVLSSQWMPFVLWGFHRYLISAAGPHVNRGALAAGALALLAQLLSSGYYMVFFGPFVALFVFAEMWTARLLRNLKVWVHVLAAGAAAVLLALPFALPYLTVRRKYTLPRSLQDLTNYSADLMAWLTASPLLNVWGTLQTFVKLEGALFPGITIVVLAVIGLWRGWRTLGAKDPASRRARGAVVFCTTTIVLSFWLSLGPEVQIRARPTAIPAIYPVPYRYLPGYDVARVPARFAMITVFAMAIAAGLALARADGRRRWLVVACGMLILVEGAALPLPRNVTWTSAPNALVAPEPRVYPEATAPPVYRFIRTLDNAVMAHLPFGAPEREIQYVYYSAMHRRRILNGYSGAFPPSYYARLFELQNAGADPRAAAVRLISDGATHLVIHAGAWKGETGQKLVEAFDRSKEFTRIAHFDRDYVYRLQ